MGDAVRPAQTGSLVLEERQGNVATLRLNRPERLNALNVELGQAILAGLRRVADDESIRCVVLTGAGRGFCAGGDLALLRDVRSRNAPHELEALLRAGKEIVLTIAMMPKPVLAAVNGPAAGGGMNLALACDVRIASELATFGEAFAQVGLFPDFGGMYFLPRLVGISRAAELFYAGEIISAAEAGRIGIVNHVVSADKFEAETRAFAERLAGAPPLAMRAVKQVLLGSQRAELEAVLEEEIRRQVVCFASEDCAEALDAFFAKRKPQYRGR